MNRKQISALKKILGSKLAISTPEELELASYDGTDFHAIPSVVVHASCAEDVAKTLAYANEHSIPVTPRGAATGLSGGSVPVTGGISLNTEHMKEIISISREDCTAVAQPGILVADFQRELAGHGLFYPPDPSSAAFSTLGGNVAECAGGLRALKYGVTRDYILAIQAVLPDGTIIDTGSAAHKTVAGYDLTRLLVGSEGTLAVFTKITVRLLPLPAEIALVSAYYGSAEAAVSAAIEMLAEGFFPRAVEFMDELSIASVISSGEAGAPEGTRACLLIETDGPEGCAVREAQDIREFLQSTSPVETRTAVEAKERESLWNIRRQISPAIYNVSPVKVSEDICVARSKVLELLGKLRSIESKHGVKIASYGHLGDGNLHVNILDEKSPDPRRKLDEVISDIFDATLELGGSISGEHGIGLAKKAFLPREIGAVELGLMRGIKEIFDPKGILNPGKIF